MSSRVVDQVEIAPASNGHSPEPAPAEPRRPFLPVALALLGVVALVLAGAFVLDRQFRKPVGIEPAPSIAAPAPTAGNTNIVARVAPTSAQRTAAASSTTAPMAAAIPTTLTAALAATAPAAQPTVDPLQREIAEAYLRYWDVRRAAYLAMDPVTLEQALAGDELTRERGYMEQLRAEGRAARIDVQHKFVVLDATPDAALVYDEYINKSPLIDLATGQELALGSDPVTRRISFQMRKIGGIWKVVDGSKHD